jgi:hypothetical protein
MHGAITHDLVRAFCDFVRQLQNVLKHGPEWCNGGPVRTQGARHPVGSGLTGPGAPNSMRSRLGESVMPSPVLENGSFPPPPVESGGLCARAKQQIGSARARACLCMVILMCTHVPITHDVSQEAHTSRDGVNASRIGMSCVDPGPR